MVTETWRDIESISLFYLHCFVDITKLSCKVRSSGKEIKWLQMHIHIYIHLHYINETSNRLGYNTNLYFKVTIFIT